MQISSLNVFQVFRTPVKSCRSSVDRAPSIRFLSGTQVLFLSHARVMMINSPFTIKHCCCSTILLFLSLSKDDETPRTIFYLRISQLSLVILGQLVTELAQAKRLHILGVTLFLLKTRTINEASKFF